MVSSYPKSTGITRIDGLSTVPQVLGRHNIIMKIVSFEFSFTEHVVFSFKIISYHFDFGIQNFI